MRNKVIFFGAGRFLDSVMRKRVALPHTDLLWICDNSPNLEGKIKYGLEIRRPESLVDTAYDYVVITSIYACEIGLQLKKIGVNPHKIKTYKEYVGICFKGKYEEYKSKVRLDDNDVMDTVLLITTDLAFSGGSWAAVYALVTLKKRGFKVYLMAPGGDRNFAYAANEYGIDVWIYPNVKFEAIDEMSWLPHIDYVIINTYPMNPCLKNLQFGKKVIWWLHEAINYYDDNLKMSGKLSNEELDCADIYAVSQSAKDAFLSYYPQKKVNILEYGIPDEYEEDACVREENDTIFMALIGTICPRKGQDIFIRAISLLPGNVRNQCEFFIVGDVDDEIFNAQIMEQGCGISCLHFLAGMRHEDLMNLYNKMDVVVSASREDPLPIVVTEGLMLGKLCIISDSIGTMRYVNQQEVMCFRVGDAENLASCFRTVVENRGMLKNIRPIARKVYETYFSQKSFSDRLSNALANAEENVPLESERR